MVPDSSKETVPESGQLNMHASNDDPQRFLREAVALSKLHRDDTAVIKEQRLRSRLEQLQADGWSQYDRDRVEERARLPLHLPQRREEGLK
jgi:hypothetical protein